MTIGKPEQLSTRVVFLVVGIAMACLAPIVPLMKHKLQLDEGSLGNILLCTGLGSVTTMPFAGGFAAKFGCKKVTFVALAFALGVLPFIPVCANPTQLAVALFIFGAGIATLDVVVNIQAVIVERAAGRSLMSGFHGLFSVGGFIGAGFLTLSLGALTPEIALSLASGLCFLVALATQRGLLPFGSEEESAAFAFPKGRVLLIGILAFILFLAEGSVLDWSGVFLNTVRGVEKTQAGVGYMAFAIMMTIGRLSGDRIVSQFGGKHVLWFGGLTASLGFVVVASIPSTLATVVGFALVGTGASNVVPVLFTAAGNQASMPTNLAISAVSTLGYAGILLGPSIIGHVARATSLPVSILGVAGLLVFVVLSAKHVTAAQS